VVKITHAIQYNVTCAYTTQRWGWASTGCHTMSSSIEANCFCCSVSVNLQSFFVEHTAYRYRCMHRYGYNAYRYTDTKRDAHGYTHSRANGKLFRIAWARIHPRFGPLTYSHTHIYHSPPYVHPH